MITRSTSGMSLLEIVVAIAIVALVFPPIIELLQTFNEETIIESPISGTSSIQILDPNVSWNSGGTVATLEKRGAIWKPSRITEQRSLYDSCYSLYTGLIFATSTPHVFTYTKAQLGIASSSGSSSSSSFVTGVAVIGQYLFLSVNSSSTTEPDLYSYKLDLISQPDSSNSQNPPHVSLISKINTGPGITVLKQRGEYIFAGNSSVLSQVQIIDVSDPYNMNVYKSFVTPGSNSTTKPLTKSFTFVKDRLIVGTEKSILPEITIFDMKSGTALSTIETGYGVNDLFVAKDLLFVAGPKDPEIEMFDISTVFASTSTNVSSTSRTDSTSSTQLQFPQKVGEYDAPGGSGNGKSIRIVGDTLYLGRTKGGDELLGFKYGFVDPENHDFLSVFFTDIKNILSVVHMTDLVSAKVGWSIDTLVPYEPYIIALTADSQKEFQIYEEVDSAGVGNIVTDTTTKIDLKLQTSIDLPSRTSGVACVQKDIFIALQSQETPLVVLSFQ